MAALGKQSRSLTCTHSLAHSINRWCPVAMVGKMMVQVMVVLVMMMVHGGCDDNGVGGDGDGGGFNGPSWNFGKATISSAC